MEFEMLVIYDGQTWQPRTGAARVIGVKASEFHGNGKLIADVQIGA